MTTLKKLSLIATFAIVTAPSIGLCSMPTNDLEREVLITGLTATGIGISGAVGAIVTAVGIDKVCVAKKIKEELALSQQLKKAGKRCIVAGTAMMLPLATIVAITTYDYSQIPSELKQPRIELTEEPKDQPIEELKDQTA